MGPPDREKGDILGVFILSERGGGEPMDRGDMATNHPKQQTWFVEHLSIPHSANSYFFSSEEKDGVVEEEEYKVARASLASHDVRGVEK